MAKTNNRQLHYCQTAYGQIFWDENKEIITGIHENDGEFRKEYFSSLMEHFGIDVKEHKEIPKFVEEWDEYENYGEVEEFEDLYGGEDEDEG